MISFLFWTSPEFYLRNLPLSDWSNNRQRYDAREEQRAASEIERDLCSCRTCGSETRSGTARMSDSDEYDDDFLADDDVKVRFNAMLLWLWVLRV